jgi:hypothetical protein
MTPLAKPLYLLRRCRSCGAWYTWPATYASRCPLCKSTPLPSFPKTHVDAPALADSRYCPTCGIIVLPGFDRPAHCITYDHLDLKPIPTEVLEWLSEEA